MKISIIAAVADNRVIGRAGDLPWHLQADLKRFGKLTGGHTVIVGRKTHESIVRQLGGPLKDRVTVVLSHRADYWSDECIVVRTWREALNLIGEGEEGFVIGGADIYRLTLPYVQKVYLTRVHASPEGDTFFPEVNWEDWQLVSSESFQRDERNEYDFTFEVWERRNT